MTQFILSILFVFCCLFALTLPEQKTRKQKELLGGMTIILILLATFRPSTMADYNAYISALKYGSTRFEPTFNLIRNITLSLNFSFIFSFFIYACLSIIIRVKAISETSPFLWGSMAIYLSYIMVVHDMIQIRAAVVSALFLFAIKFWLDRKIWRLIITIAIAILFHYSAISLIFILFLNTKEPRRGVYLALIAISYILALSNSYLTNIISFIPINFVQAALRMYPMESLATVNIFNAVQLGRIFICLLFWAYIKTLQNKNSNSVLYLKIYTWGICFLPIFANSSVIAFRLYDLFTVSEIILIPMGFLILFKEKIIGKIATLLFATAMFLITITSTLYWGSL